MIDGVGVVTFLYRRLGFAGVDKVVCSELLGFDRGFFSTPTAGTTAGTGEGTTVGTATGAGVSEPITFLDCRFFTIGGGAISGLGSGSRGFSTA